MVDFGRGMISTYYEISEVLVDGIVIKIAYFSGCAAQWLICGGAPEFPVPV